MVNGYITLLTMLIVGAASTAIAMTLLFTGIDAQRSSLMTQQSAQARAGARACGEEALQKIYENTSFVGNGNLTLDTATCTYTITSTGASTRTISSTGTVENVVRKVQIYVTINTSNISITSWQEVS